MSQWKHVLIAVGGWNESDPLKVRSLIASVERQDNSTSYHCLAYCDTAHDIKRAECICDPRKRAPGGSYPSPSNTRVFERAASGMSPIPLTEVYEKIALGPQNDREIAYDAALILTSGLQSVWKPERPDSITVTTSIRSLQTHVIAIHIENPSILDEGAYQNAKQSLRHATNQVVGVAHTINKNNAELAGILHVAGMVLAGVIPVRRDVEAKYGANSQVAAFYQKCANAFVCK